MKKYCTFWYPTIFHQNLRRLYSEDKKLSDICELEKRNISDTKKEKMNSILAWFSVFLAMDSFFAYFLGNDQKTLGFKIWGIISFLVILYFVKTFWTEYGRSKKSTPAYSNI